MQAQSVHPSQFQRPDFFDKTYVLSQIRHINEPLILVKTPETSLLSFLPNLTGSMLQQVLQGYHLQLKGIIPAMPAQQLGNANFRQQYHLKLNYVVGEMAHGIATTQMVIAAAKSGLFGCFGAAGLLPDEIEKSIHTIQAGLGTYQSNWASNLIYMPTDPVLEERVVALYLRLGVRTVSASAYMSLTPQLVHYAVKGLALNRQGKIIRQNKIMAKVSRPEVAKHFLCPPPKKLLNQLYVEGKITELEAKLASALPLAYSITVEADSGGHTDNRPMTAIFPVIKQMALEEAATLKLDEPPYIGVAGGLGTPAGLAAAFSMGADYVLTGSINAAAVESGFSADAKKMLASAQLADVMMAPAADMFELGVKLQVLKHGTFFGTRSAKLYELYKNYASLASIPLVEKDKIEKLIFQASLDAIWDQTKQYFDKRDPQQVARALRDPKHQMALVFRWYLGQATHWAMQGEVARRSDYQIWCGPAMGTFNNWVKNSFLANLPHRTVTQMGFNLMRGAAIVLRAQQLQGMGAYVPAEAFYIEPINMPVVDNASSQ